MKPSEQCKVAGLKNLKELSTIAKVSSETLVNWSKNRPDVFRLLVAGVVSGNIPVEQTSMYKQGRNSLRAEINSLLVHEHI